MNVYLVRHTRPDLDGSRCYGRMDAGLLSGWEDQAAALRTRLPAAAPILSAPEKRCRLLADALARAAGIGVSIDERLQELDFGSWEGLPWAQIPHVESNHWARDVWNRAPPGGETYAALHARVSAVWQMLVLMDCEAVVVVGSAGPLKALVTIALELPRDSFVRLHIDCGGTALLSDASGGWRLEFANR